jgi:NADPH-dependent 7-cyano-7-deazaguanine reductase QueF
MPNWVITRIYITGPEDKIQDLEGKCLRPNRDEDGEFQGNNLAYKSVDIDRNLLRDELKLIRDHRYSVLGEIAHQYDFGLLWLDCSPLKQAVVEHCL